MKKKRRQEDPEHPDRWIVSYADFITLLFAFFTTMYALSHVDLGKLDLFQGSMRSAFKAAGPYPMETTVIEGIKPINYADISLEKEITEQFRKFGIIESIIITREDRGVSLSFGDNVLFDSGSADLKNEAKPLLAAAASLIKRSQRSIIIEGHSDNIPLQSQRYSSNLELATARAARAFSYLVTEEALQPDRISASGYGEYRPAATNATLEGRARNRRVDIIFVSKKTGT